MLHRRARTMDSDARFPRCWLLGFISPRAGCEGLKGRRPVRAVTDRRRLPPPKPVAATILLRSTPIHPSPSLHPSIHLRHLRIPSTSPSLCLSPSQSLAETIFFFLSPLVRPCCCSLVVGPVPRPSKASRRTSPRLCSPPPFVSACRVLCCWARESRISDGELPIASSRGRSRISLLLVLGRYIFQPIHQLARKRRPDNQSTQRNAR